MVAQDRSSAEFGAAACDNGLARAFALAGDADVLQAVAEQILAHGEGTIVGELLVEDWVAQGVSVTDHIDALNVEVFLFDLAEN